MKTKILLFMFCALQVVGADISLFRVQLGRVAAPPDGMTQQDAIDTLVGNRQLVATSVIGIQMPSMAKIADRYRSLRNDTQTGASSSSAGSTSLVLSPYIADILGISLESGAILKTVSGNTINFQLKPAGLFCATKNGDATKAIHGLASDMDCLNFWKRVGLSAAFDKSRSNAPSQLVALQDDFSEFRVHFDLLAPAIENARKAAQAAMEKNAVPANDIAVLFEEGSRDANPKLLDWNKQTTIALKTAAALSLGARQQAVEKAWSDALDRVQRLFQTEPELKQKLEPLVLPFAKTYLDANLKAITVDQLKRTSFALEYSLQRPSVASMDVLNASNVIVAKGQRPPDLSTARVLYARNYQPWILSANGEASWFNQTLPGMNGQFRNWQISAAATFILKEIPNMGKTTLTFAGLIGDLHQQPLGFDYVVPQVGNPSATQKINLTGSFRAFNTRLEFPTANKSVTIPLSFTYANRTDLIKEADVRGSLGITIRFDSFFPTP